MSAIVDVIASEILDSHGNPTIEADVYWESSLLELEIKMTGNNFRSFLDY